MDRIKEFAEHAIYALIVVGFFALMYTYTAYIASLL